MLWDWPWIIGAWFASLLVPVIVIGGIIWLIAIVARRPNTGPSKSSALEILEERYARGEIDREEFLERRSLLQRSDG